MWGWSHSALCIFARGGSQANTRPVFALGRKAMSAMDRWHGSIAACNLGWGVDASRGIETINATRQLRRIETTAPEPCHGAMLVPLNPPQARGGRPT